MNEAISIEAGDMGLVIAFVLLIGGIIKNFTPVNNKWIPLITWALGGLLYQWLAGGWADPRQWMMALISVAGATGLHAATKSTLEKPADGPPPAVNIPPANHFGVWVVVAALSFGAVGCRTLEPGGVYNGDKVLFEAETTIVTSYDLVNTFLKWEQENRAVLQTWPEIKKYADKLRTDYPHWHRTAVVIRDAYALAPNETQAAHLQKSLVLLRAALTEASGYMARAAGN